MTKRIALLLAGLLAVYAVFFIFVEVLGRAAWSLSPAGDTSLSELDRVEPPERHPSEPEAVHRVSEWSADRGRDFAQAPMLAERVERGDLPPVAERLPQNPLVITPPEQDGPYGGTWMRLAKGPSDVGVFEARIAYEGLVRWDAMGRQILPNLAVKWDIADGGRTYTFWLRRGVRWSDGHPFTTADLMFWYEDVLLNKELTPVVARDLRRGGEVVQLDALGDYTIRFHFKEPHGIFLQTLASGLGYIPFRFPAHYLKQFHRKYAAEEVLQAKARENHFDYWHQLFGDKASWMNPDCPRLWAWVVSEPPPARPAVFVRNPYYWKVDADGNQLPYIDRITFDVYDNETINLKAMNGEVGMQSRHLAFTNYPLFMENRERGGYRLFHWISAGGGENILALNLNHKDPVLREIFGDRRFRIALSYALNRQELNEVAFFGIARPRQVSPPAASPYYDPAYEKAYVKYNPDKANRLLDEMGLDEKTRDGIRLRPDGKPLAIRIEVPDVFVATQLFELVAQHWTAVGVKAEMKLEARQLFYNRKAAMLHDVGVWGAADEVLPIMDPRWFLPYSPESIWAIGYARWFNTEGQAGQEPTGDLAKALALYRRILKTPEPQEHIRLFKKIIDLNRKNLWVIGTLGDVPTIFVVNDRFRNVPEVAIAGWVFRTPGNTAPECYAIKTEAGE